MRTAHRSSSSPPASPSYCWSSFLLLFLSHVLCRSCLRASFCASYCLLWVICRFLLLPRTAV
eukprot:8666951-Pyramimonas_sp.AAC.1